MMFLHQGQRNMKELRFHPQYQCLMVTTAEDSFNIFRPNLEPVDSSNDEDREGADANNVAMAGNEETK